MAQVLPPLRQDVQGASMWFLEESPLYATVKPYCLAFTPATEIPRENIKRHEVPVSISDLRGSEDQFCLNRNGFMVLRFDDEHPQINWDDRKAVESHHYPRVAAAIERAIPSARALGLHHQLRKRDTLFPKSTGADYQYGQPLRAAHVDMVASSAQQLIQERAPASLSKTLFFGESRPKHLIVNVWHPLRGPNQDWPLALCDTSTVDPSKDLEVADYVTPTACREHCMVYARPSHRWWYLSHQRATEALMFRQHDPAVGPTSGVPHAAFENPYSDQEWPRESAEVVMLIYFPSLGDGNETTDMS